MTAPPTEPEWADYVIKKVDDVLAETMPIVASAARRAGYAQGYDDAFRFEEWNETHGGERP